MTKNITRFEKKLRKISNQRPKSLILTIPSQIRDEMELEHGTHVIIRVCQEKDGNKYIKIQKKSD